MHRNTCCPRASSACRDRIRIRCISGKCRAARRGPPSHRRLQPCSPACPATASTRRREPAWPGRSASARPFPSPPSRSRDAGRPSRGHLCRKSRRAAATRAWWRARFLRALARRFEFRSFLASARCSRRVLACALRRCLGAGTVTPSPVATMLFRPTSIPTSGRVSSSPGTLGSRTLNRSVTYHFPFERLTVACTGLAGSSRCQRTLTRPGTPTSRSRPSRQTSPSPTRKSALWKRDFARKRGKPGAEGISERRITVGSGYRLCFGQDGKSLSQ